MNNDPWLPGRSHHGGGESTRALRRATIQSCQVEIRQEGSDKVGWWRLPPGGSPSDYLICPSSSPTSHRSAFGRSLVRRNHAGRELAPAFTTRVNRLLWRHRARPSATLDKMRTELLFDQSYTALRAQSSPQPLVPPIARQAPTAVGSPCRYGPGTSQNGAIESAPKFRANLPEIWIADDPSIAGLTNASHRPRDQACGLRSLATTRPN